MKQWLSFRNITFIIFLIIFILYAIRIIDFNPRLLPLIMLVSVYLLTCKNWKIFSKENRENFQDTLGTIVIPANLLVKGKLTVEGSTKCQDMDTGNVVANNITSISLTAKDVNVTSIHANKKHHANINMQQKVNFNGDCEMKTVNATTINTRNLTSTWGTGGAGAGIVKIAKLQVDQLYGCAWEGTKTNTILVSDNLTFSTPNSDAVLMRFTTAHGGRGDDKPQGMVIIDGAELRIHNRGGTHKWATHFNHKTKPESDSGYYGNWIRGGTLELNNNDDLVYVGVLNVRATSTLNGNFFCNGVSYFQNQVQKGVYSHINWSDGKCYIRGDIMHDGAGETGSHITSNAITCIGNFKCHGPTWFENQVKKGVYSHFNWVDGNCYIRGNVSQDGYGETGANITCHNINAHILYARSNIEGHDIKARSAINAAGRVTCGDVYTGVVDTDQLKGHAWGTAGHIYIPQGIVLHKDAKNEIRLLNNKMNIFCSDLWEIRSKDKNMGITHFHDAISLRPPSAADGRYFQSFELHGKGGVQKRGAGQIHRTWIDGNYRRIAG